MSNRFRDPVLKQQYEQMLRFFRTRHKELIYLNGSRCRGNAAATYFWRGYDGVTKPLWDRNSKKTPAYACFRAGQDVKILVNNGVYEDVPTC